MRKGRERNQSRSRFDDDQPDATYEATFRPAPRADAAPTGPAIDAVVKWFNPEKGFGFVELADGSGDAFLHIAVLECGGHDTVLPETKLRVQVGQGQKGRQVTAVLELDTSIAVASPPRMSDDRVRPDPATASEIHGTAKWFNGQKGFGFVAAEDGGKDVFLHISIVDRAGIQVLPEGQQVRMRVVKTQKGREAISVALIDQTPRRSLLATPRGITLPRSLEVHATGHRGHMRRFRPSTRQVAGPAFMANCRDPAVSRCADAEALESWRGGGRVVEYQVGTP